MYKLNILPVALLDRPVSKNGAIFSHEPCDICGTKGIKFEAISYKGIFDYHKLKYRAYTYKKYNIMSDDTKKWFVRCDGYLIYYLCSKECAMMVQLQRED
jgi:hypothetical protein